ncbi:hypothetical protein [Nocardioides maradonensis]
MPTLLGRDLALSDDPVPHREHVHPELMRAFVVDQGALQPSRLA